MIWTKQDWLVRNGKRSGALGGIRTPDTWFRRPVLYPLSYERLLSMLAGRPRECKTRELVNAMPLQHQSHRL